MVFNLVINANNVSTENYQYRYDFRRGGFEVYGDENNEGEQAQLCISTATIPYSWYPVNKENYGNNTLSYIWGGTANLWTGYGIVQSNTTLNIALFSGGTPSVGDFVSGAGIPSFTYITAIQSSTASYGLYTISQSSTNTSSTALSYPFYFLKNNRVFDATDTLNVNQLIGSSRFINNLTAITSVVAGTFNAIYNTNTTVSVFSTAVASSTASLFVGSDNTVAWLKNPTGLTGTAPLVNYLIGDNVFLFSSTDTYALLNGTYGSSTTGNLGTTYSVFVYGGTLTSQTPAFTVNNAVIYQSGITTYRCYYTSITGTYSTNAYIDNLTIQPAQYPNGSYSNGANQSSLKYFPITLQNTAIATPISTPSPSTFTLYNTGTNTVVGLSALVSQASFAVNSFLMDTINVNIANYITAINTTTGVMTVATPALTTSSLSGSGYVSSSGGSAGAYTANFTFTANASGSLISPVYITGSGIPVQSFSSSNSGSTYNVTSTNPFTNTSSSSALVYYPTTTSMVLPANQTSTSMYEGSGIQTGSYSTTSGTNVVSLVYGTATASTGTNYTGIIYTNGTNYWLSTTNLPATNSYVVEATSSPNTSAVITTGSATGTNTFLLNYKTAPTAGSPSAGSGISFYFSNSNVVVLQIGSLSTTPTTLLTSVQLNAFVVLGQFFFYGVGSLGGLGYIPTTASSSAYGASTLATMTTTGSPYVITTPFLTTTTSTTTTGFTFVVGSATGIVAGDFINITSAPLSASYNPSSVQVVSVVGTTITTNYSIVWGAGTKNVSFIHAYNTFNVYGSGSTKTFTNYVASSISVFNPILTSIFAYQGYNANVYAPLPVSVGFYSSNSAYSYYPPTNSVPTYTNTLTPYGTYNTITFPNGNYSVSQINSYIEDYMVSKNQYLTQTSTGQKLYYISLTSSTTTYGNQFILTPIPSTLPSGYTAPSGFPYSASGYTSAIIIPANSAFGYNFGGLIGFSTGIYPSSPQTTTQTFNSNIIPNLPVTQIIIRCNMISNGCATPDDILDVIPIANSPYGDDIIYQPSFEKWIAMKNGMYSSFFIYFQDQNYNPIPILDTNIVVSLLIKQGKRQQKLQIEQPKTKIQPLFE